MVEPRDGRPGSGLAVSRWAAGAGVQHDTRLWQRVPAVAVLHLTHVGLPCDPCAEFINQSNHWCFCRAPSRSLGDLDFKEPYK